VSTCCPYVEQCFGHPVNAYGSELCGQSKSINVSRNVPRGGTVFVFRFSVIRTDHIFPVFCSEPAVSTITCFGRSSIFFGGLPCVLLVESTQLSFFWPLAVSHLFVNHLLRRIRFRFYPAVFIFISSMSSTSQFRSFPPFEFPPDVVSSFRLDFISRFRLDRVTDLAYACG